MSSWVPLVWVALGTSRHLPAPTACTSPDEPPPLIVQVKEADPDAPVLSVAVTIALNVPAALGVPVINPEELIDNPAGRPVAVYVRLWPAAESAACACTLTIGTPTVPL